jgi:hypothetical protein
VVIADFEIDVRLAADRLATHVPPDVRTSVEGEGVAVQRDESRHGRSVQLEPGARHTDVSIGKRLRGRNERSFRLESRNPASTKFSGEPSGGSGIHGSIRDPAADKAAQSTPMSTDVSPAAKRRAQREERRKTLAVEPHSPGNGAALSGNGAESAVDQSVGEVPRSMRQSLSVRMALGAGALLGAVGGATAAKLVARRKDVITGDVRIDLLKKVELLSIKLRLDRAAKDRLR